MVAAARKNLLCNKTRLAIGLGGTLFTVILTIFAVGMMVGTLEYAVYLPEHSQADIWVLSEKSDFFNLPPFRTSSPGKPKQLYLVAFDPSTRLTCKKP